MAEKPKGSLFDAALRGMRVLKQGEVVCLIMDGGGALITFTLDFVAAQKWAQRKPETGNRVTDRGRFLEQLPTLIARPGSFVGTRGSDKIIEKLAKNMIQAGYDLGEWSLPPDVKAMAHPKAAQPAKKKDEPGTGDGDGDGDARPGPAPDDPAAG